MKVDRQIYLTIAAYFMNENSHEINDPILIDWLKESKLNRQVFEQYKKIWDAIPHYSIEKETFDVDQAWNKIYETHRKKDRNRKVIIHFLYAISGIAASVLLFLALSFMGIFEKDSTTHFSILTKNGNRSEIFLPDGSKANLNAGASILYTYNSKRKIREVTFQGEGFFDISKSEEPFVIRTLNGLVIKVLGTSFNISAYQDDAEIKVSLVEGSIEVKDETNFLLMKAGEMVVYDKEHKQLQIKEPEGILSNSYGWLDNKLYMNNMSLSEVCKHLERWYDVNITLDRDLGTSIHYYGVLQEENIIEVMTALSKLSKIQYTMKGKNIQITSK